MLIVEDQALMRHALRTVLENAFPGVAVHEAPDGASALKICHEHPPQLIVMDVCLPDGNGIELTARIKALMPETQVIVISYLSGEAYAEAARAAGGRAYICKDHLISELIPAVSDATGLSPAKGYTRNSH